MAASMADGSATAGSYSTVMCLAAGSPDRKRTPGSLDSAFSMLMMQCSQEMSGASSVTSCVILRCLLADDTSPRRQPHRRRVRGLLNRVIEGDEANVGVRAPQCRLYNVVGKRRV